MLTTQLTSSNQDKFPHLKSAKGYLLGLKKKKKKKQMTQRTIQSLGQNLQQHSEEIIGKCKFPILFINYSRPLADELTLDMF